MIKTVLMRLLAVSFVWLALSGSTWAAEEQVRVQEFMLQQDGQTKQWVANIRFDYQLTDYLRESLLNGVTLRNEIRFDLVWHSDWWFNKTENLTSIVTELKYHALSRHYQLFRKDTGENWNFSNLASALEHLGTVQRFSLPALPPKAYKSDAAIYVEAVLEPKAPQMPFSALFSEDHRLVSQGVLWPLTL